MPQSRLFKPLKIGGMEVKHRIGMAPLTRFRATEDRVPTLLMKEYYGQRAAVPGTLIITEGTFISATCGGFPHAPGLWREDQVAAWKIVTDEVHRKGCFIFCQVFAMGRAADVDLARKEANDIVAPSAIAMEEGAVVPRAMTTDEVKQIIQDYVDASKNAIQAGFDGVEVHGANGYLLDQFIQDVSNNRDDEYGGNVENRSRILDEVIKAVVHAIGRERVGLRLSPWSTFQGMRMEDPIPQFTDVISKARQAGIAYLHLVESRMSGSQDYSGHDTLDFAYDLWDGPFLVAGGYESHEARKLVDEKYPDKDIMVIFGRHFISNPDLIFRIRKGPNERRTISREDVGFYNALVIAGVYEIASENIDVNSAQSFIAPLRHCIEKYPHLSVVVKQKHTDKSAYEAVSSIDLHNHVSIIHEDEATSNGETATIEKIMPAILDRPWPADIPPWRIVVSPLVSPQDSTGTRCFIAFAFSHTLGDGMVGVAFHRTFLEAWRQTTGMEEKATFLVTPPSQTLPAPFDTPERLPISWKFLLEPLIAVYLPKFVAKILGLRASASTLDAGTWIGSPMFFDPAAAIQSRVRIIEIEAPLVQKALQASRSHGTKLTGTVHQMIVRALSKAIPSTDITNFVSGTPVDMRASIGTPGLTWGLFVSGLYEVHPRAPNVTEAILSEEMWEAARSMTQKLAECGARLQDQAIGLLRYVPSIRNWTLSKIGQKRDSSYELSNLLAFDNMNDGADQKCKVVKMVFSQPGNVTSAPLAFNMISVKGGA
ncbi:Alcohol acetyltransferase [Penicillium concentricum]|uniref:chanoclavine-I aldehyde reductase n=1 Tax=Penicillium concentricum TaxID=293559 RepID=A0A9W9SCF5_9EURO|nr:Alcohol acetyltransferase [Penicillium concentricum]KAJ5375572.1 Alcohol acetyltransferase [Penicillium concentricum]